MGTAKVKNLALIILALLNCALLVLVIPMQLQERRQNQRTAQELEALYQSAEVALPERLPEGRNLHALEATLDAEAAAAAAGAILGGSVTSESESYLLQYRSENGQCVIRRTQLEAELNGRSVSGSGVKAVERLLEEMKLTGRVAEEENGTIAAYQSVLGTEIFSSRLAFTFADGCLTGVSGTFCPVETTLIALGKECCIPCTDALVAFLNARGDTGWVGERILSAEQGYLLADTASAAKLRFTPAWRLETDTGTYFVNGLTGEVFQD